jgi:ATP-dependent helicase/nuclease subunit B
MRKPSAAIRTSPEFDGHVPHAGPHLDPAGAANIYSVTELEAAAQCPFRLFLRRGLGVRPLDERERDRDVWLTPLVRGSELHDIYAIALRRARDENRRLTTNDAVWLRQHASTRLAQLHEEMAAATPEVLERESADFLDDVDLFVDAEINHTQSTPVGFEVSFGRPLRGDTEPLAREDPVEISLGGGQTLRIAGRIDRIDETAAGTYEVLDYKTGKFYAPGWGGAFAGGTRLQHALYGLAAVELLRARTATPTVTGGVYYFSSHKGRQQRVPIPSPSLGALAKVLDDLREVIATGHFIRAAAHDTCKFCNYASACGEHTNVQANAKRSDARLQAVVRLAAHE